MTNELRLYKLHVLARGTDFVAYRDHGERDDYQDKDGNPVHQVEYELTWPYPKQQQVAYINARSGNVDRFYYVTGSLVEKATNIAFWMDTIDRRIDYLFARVDEGLKGALGISIGSTPEPRADT